MIRVEIQNIAFDHDGVEVSYYLPETDVKATGVAKMSTLMVGMGGDFDDEIDAAREAVRFLVLDVLESFEAMAAAGPPTETA